MTSAIGLTFVIFILAMIPAVFLFAGKDTTLQRAERKERQKEALLAWTDKDLLAAENGAGTAPRKQTAPARVPAAVEVIPRDLSGRAAA